MSESDYQYTIKVSIDGFQKEVIYRSAPGASEKPKEFKDIEDSLLKLGEQ